MNQTTSLCIVLGCSDLKELDKRLDLFLRLFPTNHILITGSQEECDHTVGYLTNKGVYEHFIIIENQSSDTIDNIVNTFSYLCGATFTGNNDIIRVDENYMGDIESVEYKINKYIIISSEYHIPRIKYIMKECGIFDKNTKTGNICGDKTFEFYGVPISNTLRDRTEKLIEMDIIKYKKIIKSKNKLL